MEKKTLKNLKYGNFDVEVYQVQNYPVLVYAMKGFMAKNHIGQYINDLLELAEKHRPKAMIADSSQIKVLSAEVQEIIVRDFWPKVAEMGLLYNPVVAPKSSLSSGSIERMVHNTQTISLSNGSQMEIGTFDSPESAFEWVVEKL
ncbi:hypothetical protein [Ekhidna sp.]